MRHETQHPRTQLAWTRTGLSLAGVGAIAARLLTADEPGRSLLALSATPALVLVLGALAAVRLGRTRDALVLGRVRTGALAPVLVAGMAVTVSVIALAVIIGGSAAPWSYPGSAPGPVRVWTPR